MLQISRFTIQLLVQMLRLNSISLITMVFLTANLKAGFTKSLGDAENTQIIDTTKFEFGRYYKFDIPATVKDDVVAGADIENKAAQVVNYYNPK